MATFGSDFTLALKWLQFQGKRSRPIDHSVESLSKALSGFCFQHSAWENAKTKAKVKADFWKVNLLYFLFLLRRFVWSDLYFSKMCSVDMRVQWPWTEFLSQQSRSNQSHICSIHPHVYPKKISWALSCCHHLDDLLKMK